MSRQGPDCAAHPRARGSACASAHPPESHWDSCKTPQFDPNMIPQNRRIVKWEIRRLPYKGGIGRAILPPVLPFMVCTQLPAHGHCFYVHGLLTALTHPVTGCTGSVTGKIAVYLQFVCGMLPIFYKYARFCLQSPAVRVAGISGAPIRGFGRACRRSSMYTKTKRFFLRSGNLNKLRHGAPVRRGGAGGRARRIAGFCIGT